MWRNKLAGNRDMYALRVVRGDAAQPGEAVPLDTSHWELEACPMAGGGRYQGKRLNSPNDLVYRSDGVLYFTDPPFGLPKFHDDPRRELPFTGLFRLAKGRLTLESRDFTGPNGVALSPDERTLYLTNWDEKRKVVWQYDVGADGALSNGRLFFDMTSTPGEIALDGLKVDREGNLYVSGPGGLWILSRDARHLGTIRLPEMPANFAWGEDGRTLFLTARTGLYRMRVNIPGARMAAR
jgi:gluconolactonase